MDYVNAYSIMIKTMHAGSLRNIFIGFVGDRQVMTVERKILTELAFVDIDRSD